MKPTPDNSHALRAEASLWLARRDGGFSLDEQEAFDRWRTADPAHAAVVAELTAVWAVLDLPRQDGNVPVFHSDLRALDRRRRWRWATAAAGLAAACLCVVVWRQERGGAVENPGPLTARVSLPTQQTLPDGSVVELRPGADIAVNYSPTLRRVVLRKGEAHFQVMKDRNRSFIVDAGSIEVRAVGTAFLVQREPAAVAVVVTEGRVAVDQPQPATATSATSQPIAYIDAGSRLIVPAADAIQPPIPRPLPATEMSELMAWRLPKLEFTNTTLAEAIPLFNQHNLTQLKLGDKSTGSLRVTGMFRSDNLDGFVGLLNTSFGVTPSQEGNVITLRREQ